MFLPLVKIKKQTPQAIALLLILWLSGATCALACGTTAVRAATSVANQAEAVDKQAECPLGGKGHACCQGKAGSAEKRNGKATLEEAAPIAPVFDCCTFVRVQGEKAQGANQPDAPASLTAVRFTFSAIATRRAHLAADFYRPTPLNRGSTHLRNCVFLI